MTTQANGQFSFTGLPQGAATIRVAAQGFDPFAHAILLVSGSNASTLVLRRLNTVLESGLFTTYVPYGVSIIRGVFVFLQGGFTDARPMIRGDLDFYASTPFVATVAEHRRRLIAFGRAHGFAIIGTITPATPVSLYTDIQMALQDVANRIGHNELAQAPLLIMGHSRGGCMAYQLALQASDQVIGVLPLASSGVDPCLDGSLDPSVPVYMVVGETDLPGIRPASTGAFQSHRALGGLWALAIEAGAAHQWPVSNDAIFGWAEAVTARRLPETFVPGVPVQLRAVSESSGWLADQTSHAIAPFGCFTGDKKAASWVPTEQNARHWQSVSSPGPSPIVITCAR
jgi:dienelactone hydrolase